jgi:hypothetical protein
VREFLIAQGFHFEPVEDISQNQEYKELFLRLNVVRTGVYITKGYFILSVYFFIFTNLGIVMYFIVRDFYTKNESKKNGNPPTFRKTQKTGQNLTIPDFFVFLDFFPRYLKEPFTICKERCAEYVYQV